METPKDLFGLREPLIFDWPRLFASATVARGSVFWATRLLHGKPDNAEGRIQEYQGLLSLYQSQREKALDDDHH